MAVFTNEENQQAGMLRPRFSESEVVKSHINVKKDNSGRIPELLENQNVQLNRLSEILADLAVRLQPVMGPIEPEPQTSSPDKAPVYRHSDVILENNRRIMNMQRSIAVILEHLEL